MTEDKNNIEGKETRPLEQFIGRNPLESYTYWINYEPRNPQTRYTMLIKTITFGMELLPKHTDKEKQEKIDILYTKAANALKTEILNKRKITYKYLDAEHYVYELTATDADECTAVKDELETMKNDFKDQQYEQHISKLQEIHNQIYHELTQADIV